MSTIFLDRPVLHEYTQRGLPDAEARDAAPAGHPDLILGLATAEAQGVTLAEALAWISVAVWGGAMLLMVVFDLAHWYRHHGTFRSGRAGGARQNEDSW